MRTVLILSILVLGACNSPPAPEDTQTEDTGRPETKSIQGVDAVGYNGTAIRGKVDAALDQNDERISEIDAQIDAQSGDGETQEQ